MVLCSQNSHGLMFMVLFFCFFSYFASVAFLLSHGFNWQFDKRRTSEKMERKLSEYNVKHHKRLIAIIFFFFVFHSAQ